MREQKEGSALERASHFLDLPADVLAGLPRIQIVGCREIMIENHKGILLYEQTDIHIGGGKVIIKLRGSGLNLLAMNATDLLIRGELFSVEFEY